MARQTRWILFGPRCQIAQISAEQLGAAAEDGGAILVHGAFPLL